MAAGAVLPWLETWRPYVGVVHVSGFERAGDAALVLEAGAVAFVLTWSDRAWSSRTTLLVAGPLVLTITCLLLLRVAYGDGLIYIRSFDAYGGHGSVLPGFWIAAVGAGAATIPAAVHLWQARGRLSFDLGLTVPAVGGAIGGVAGAVGGFMAGVTIAQLFTAGAIAGVVSSVLVPLAIALAFVGGWLGAVGGARLVRSTRRR
jgi:hypothetical protein